MPKAVIILAPGFEEVEAVTPIDFLRRANIEVCVVGLNALDVTGSRQLTIKADTTIDDIAGNFDALIIPGGLPGADNLAADARVQNLIKEHHRKKGLLAAICAAPARVLAPLGALDNRQATCYPGFETEMAAPIQYSDQTVVIDGNLITGQGPGTAADFSLAIIACLIDQKAADQVAKSALIAR